MVVETCPYCKGTGIKKKFSPDRISEINCPKCGSSDTRGHLYSSKRTCFQCLTVYDPSTGEIINE